MSTITPLPTPAPSRTQPAETFIAAADALLGALPAMVTETNVVVGEVNANTATASAAAVTASAAAVTASAAAATTVAAPGSGATSATSVTIGTGTKSFTVQTGKNFFLGMWLLIAETAAPATNWMAGQVTSYDTGTGALAVSVSVTHGSGTISAWTISVSGVAQEPFSVAQQHALALSF